MLRRVALAVCAPALFSASVCFAQQAPAVYVSRGVADPPLPPPEPPKSKPGNPGMMTAGIVLGALGGLMLVPGVYLLASGARTTDTEQCNYCGAFGGTYSLFGGILTGLGALQIALGVPLAVAGGQPATPAKPAAVAWSLSPLVVSPLRPSSGPAPAPPAGISLVGTF